MRIFATMCVRNERGRYLVDSLIALESIVDGVAVYDDRSDDTTVQLAKSFRPHVQTKVRPEDRPSFNDHEALFRQDAWQWLGEAFQPNQDDWVLSLDADEFLVVADPESDVRRELEEFSQLYWDNAGTFIVAEVFGWADDGCPLIRCDGFWNRVNATRFCRWTDAPFDEGNTRGGGSLPGDARRPARTFRHVELLHFGYAREEDRVARHARYTADAGAHNASHIESILRKPTLVRWEGSVPRHVRAA